MLTSLAYVFLLGMLLGWVFSRIGLPSLLGMLVTGILLGPCVLNRSDPALLGISADLRQLALIIILTRAGLSLNIADLKRVGRPAVLMCFVPACFEICGMVLLAPKMLGITALEAAVMGAVIAAVSPSAVIVRKTLRLTEEGYGTAKSIPQMILAGASVDDALCHGAIYRFHRHFPRRYGCRDGFLTGPAVDPARHSVRRSAGAPACIAFSKKAYARYGKGADNPERRIPAGGIGKPCERHCSVLAA